MNRVLSLAEAIPLKEALAASACPKRLEAEGVAFCVVCGKKAQLHRCGLCGGPLHLTCAKNGAVVSDDEPGVGLAMLSLRNTTFVTLLGAPLHHSRLICLEVDLGI